MKTVTFDEGKWKLVPVEPTWEMVKAAWDDYESNPHPGVGSFWKAMLAAAPEGEQK